MPLLTPHDLVVCDPDLLWRVEHMNAASRVNAHESATIAGAVKDLTPAHPTVILIGPNEVSDALRQLRSLERDDPNWQKVVVLAPQDRALESVARQAGVALALDSSLSPAELVERVLALLPADLDEVAAEEAEAEALESSPMARGTDLESASLVFVTAAKGGEGVTTLAVNLAAVLAADGRRSVTLFEGDSAFGDLSLLLGLPEPVHYDVRQIRSVDADVVDRLTVLDEATGVRVLRAPVGWEVGELSASFVRDALAVAGADSDVIVIDTPFALLQDDTLLRDVADVILLVTDQSVASMKNALVATRVLGRPESMHVVLNAATKGNAEELTEQLADVVGSDVLIELPHEPWLDRMALSPEPEVLAPPRSRYHKAVVELSDRLGSTVLRRRSLASLSVPGGEGRSTTGS